MMQDNAHWRVSSENFKKFYSSKYFRVRRTDATVTSRHALAFGNAYSEK